MKKTSSLKKPRKKITTYIQHFIEHRYYILLAIIILVGMYVRFYNANYIFGFGYDQGRDAWVVRDIVNGYFYLEGPRTGVGHMHLGPLYYYLLVPFFWFNHMNPVGMIYLSGVVNFATFCALFYVTKKIFNVYGALFVTLLYATNHYFVIITRTPWNVVFVPIVSIFIFYSIYQVYQEKYKWTFVAWTLAGLFFHFHFTAVFLPVILLLSGIFVKDKKKVFLYSLLSIPLYFVWFVPNIIALLHQHGVSQYTNFFDNYFVGVHGRFILYRLPANLTPFDLPLGLPFSSILKYIIPIAFGLVLFFEKDKKQRILDYLIAVWFIVPAIFFSIYGGGISDYYYLICMPYTLYVFWILIVKLYRLNPPTFLVLILVLLTFYVYHNTQGLWLKPVEGGNITDLMISTRENIEKGEIYPYEEGHIQSYLYGIWVVDKRK